MSNTYGAYAGTIKNLQDLLKTSFPIRFAKNDRQALLEEIIADNAISRIRRECEKADNILVHGNIVTDSCHILCHCHIRQREVAAFGTLTKIGNSEIEF